MCVCVCDYARLHVCRYVCMYDYRSFICSECIRQFVLNDCEYHQSEPQQWYRKKIMICGRDGDDDDDDGVVSAGARVPVMCRVIEGALNDTDM